MGQPDFFSTYFSYVGDTESPAIFHRWSAISSVGAFLGRDYGLNHGHFTLYPNIYSMLIGSPGTRKSTSIKLMKSLLMQSGFTKIAAEKTTKEKFLMDLAGEDGSETGKPEDILDTNLWGQDDENLASAPPAELFIMADEFNDFFGNGNIEFISLLGTLWDFSGVYRNRVKHGKSISIPNPTISILGGNTPTGFSLAFPTEILGQGFFSRILLIYGEPSGKRIPFPSLPTVEDTKVMVEMLKEIKKCARGMAEITPIAKKLLEKVYTSWRGVDDVRFESYSNRRFTHLLKLCLIFSAARFDSKISETDVVYANTVLTHTESLMPKALGEFGKAKHSDVAHKIITVLDKAVKPLVFKEIWKEVHNDLDKATDLSSLLQNLMVAEKIQSTQGGFLRKRKEFEEVSTDLIDYDLLTKEEREMSK